MKKRNYKITFYMTDGIMQYQHRHGTLEQVMSEIVLEDTINAMVDNCPGIEVERISIDPE